MDDDSDAQDIARVIFRVELTQCPTCGNKLTAGGNPSGTDLPSPGDATVCFDCGHVMLFGEGLTLRDPEPGEMERAFKKQPEFESQIKAMQSRVREIRNKRQH